MSLPSSTYVRYTSTVMAATRSEADCVPYAVGLLVVLSLLTQIFTVSWCEAETGYLQTLFGRKPVLWNLCCF